MHREDHERRAFPEAAPRSQPRYRSAQRQRWNLLSKPWPPPPKLLRRRTPGDFSGQVVHEGSRRRHVVLVAGFGEASGERRQGESQSRRLRKSVAAQTESALTIPRRPLLLLHKGWSSRGGMEAESTAGRWCSASDTGPVALAPRSIGAVAAAQVGHAIAAAGRGRRAGQPFRQTLSGLRWPRWRRTSQRLRTPG